MLEVLQDKSQIARARQEIARKEVSLIDSPLKAILKRFGLVGGIAMGDYVKSWDVLHTLEFLDAHVARTDPVADFGCFASEVLIALHKLGFTDLVGVDLNPRLGEMPFQDCIRYVVSDFKKTQFPAASFQAITSVSVIEHGFDAHALMQEVSRILRPGGYFLASFDYWPERIDTSSIKFFGMDWLIFSEDDVHALLQTAAQYGLQPAGPLNFAAKDRPISCARRKYTFGFLALRKAA